MSLLAEDKKNESSYSTYMNGEPIIYIDAYATYTYSQTSQAVIGMQIGIYEELYLVGGYGYYSREEDYYKFTNGDSFNLGSTGTFVNYGLSYHIQNNKNSLITIDAVYRQMLDETYDIPHNPENFRELKHSTVLVTASHTWFRPNKPIGFEMGIGIGEDVFLVKAGLKFRYF